MTWYWSDDVARAAIEAGLISEQVARESLNRPVAHALESDMTLLEAADKLFAAEDIEVAGAA